MGSTNKTYLQKINNQQKHALRLIHNKNRLYHSKPYLNNDSLLGLHFSFIHSYINYANLVWGITNKTYSQKINSQQKHVIRLITCFCCEIFIIYKLNLLLKLRFSCTKWKNRTAPSSFLEESEESDHSYPTCFSSGNYRKP